jgi:hypothetical protein
LSPFCIFCGHFVYFVAILYILWPFCTFCGHFVYFVAILCFLGHLHCVFFPVLVRCTEKKSGNLVHGPMHCAHSVSVGLPLLLVKNWIIYIPSVHWYVILRSCTYH